jgi:hypothetical protein
VPAAADIRSTATVAIRTSATQSHASHGRARVGDAAGAWPMQA